MKCESAPPVPQPYTTSTAQAPPERFFYWFPMPPAIEIPDDLRRQAHVYYMEHPSVSLQAIATYLGVSGTTFFRLRKAWGWPPRREVAASGNGGPEGQPPAGRASSLREAAMSLARVTQSHIDALVKEQRMESGLDHDRLARILASYAKSLATAKGLLEQEGSSLDDSRYHDDDRRTIHQLRDELARHLERIVAEEEIGGRHGLVVGSGSEGAPAPLVPPMPA